MFIDGCLNFSCQLLLQQDSRNTIGNIPVEWYNDYPHIGYDLHGKRILKPATADEVGSITSVLHSSHLKGLSFYNNYCLYKVVRDSKGKKINVDIEKG